MGGPSLARRRAAVRAHVWQLVCARPAGFPWLAIAGKVLAGWLVIDLDGTLITARSDKEGAAPTWKMGYGFHPLGAWLANTAESLAMLLRPGNAGSNTFTDHRAVLTDAPEERQSVGEVEMRKPKPFLVGMLKRVIGFLIFPAEPVPFRRRQPRTDHPPAVAGVPAPRRAVHLRLGHHRGR